MPNVAQLQPESQYPQPAVKRSVQEFPKPEEGMGHTYTIQLASSADTVYPWGRYPALRDSQLREFWPTEPYLAGAVTNIGMRSASLQWEIHHKSDRIEQAVTDILRTALAGDTFGWVPFMLKFSQDLATQDNGAFIELIRDPTVDANSKYQGPMAPVLGIGHLDAGRCVRTGNPKYPVRYTDRLGKPHKLAWYQVIPFSDQPSAIETMNGIGYCGVTRVLRMAQIARSLAIYKDEKISGRHIKQIHFVSGVSRQDIQDEIERGVEEANNTGMIRFMLPRILASLDPEKPVSTATIDLASLPDGFNFDEDMKWYISCLALGYGVDYQEFAPLPGGNIGSSNQSVILHRKGSGKGPAVLMRMINEAFVNYGVLPREADLRYNDKDEQEELERQNVRTKAMEEYAIAVNARILTPEAAAKDMVMRGLWSDKTIQDIPAEYWAMAMKQEEGRQPVGDRGGNTIEEDASRQDNGREGTNQTIGDRLRKALQVFNPKPEEEPVEEIEKQTIEPAAPDYEVNVMVPRMTRSTQRVVRDKYSRMEKTVTENEYEGWAVSSSDDGKLKLPNPNRQVINVKMPRVKAEEMTVVRDERGNIDHTTKKIVYEDDE